MKFPRPFVLSLILFTALAGAAFKWRAASLGHPDSRTVLSTRASDLPGNPAPARLISAFVAPSVQEILHMSAEDLQTTASMLIGGKDPVGMHRLMLVCSRMAELDPVGGICPLLKLIVKDSSGDGFFEIAGFLSTWLADERRDPAALLKSVTDPKEKKLLTDALVFTTVMMGLNPSAAAKISAALSAEATDVPGLILAAQAESAQSPESALTKLLALPENEERKLAVNFIIRNLMEKDPVQALRLAEKVPFEGAVPSIVGRALEKLVQDRPSAALDYIVSHPGPVQATDFLKRWDYLLAAAGPEAVRAAAAKVEDPDIRLQIIGHAAVGLANTEPFAAAKLMGGMEADELVMPLWQEVAAGFGKLPEARQSEWLQSLPSSPARDAAVSALAAQRMRNGFPDSGLMLLNEMDDADVRARHMILLATDWKKKDQAAADAWLSREDTGISDEVREAILKTKQRMPDDGSVP